MEDLDGIAFIPADDELDDSDIPVVDVDELAGESDVELPPDALAIPTAGEFIAEYLKVAAQYIGVSRKTNLPQVAKFLAIFNLPTKMDGKWVPFCAAGASYAAAKSWCNLNGIPYNAENSVQVFKKVLPSLKAAFFLPSPSCYQIRDNAKSRGTWTAKDSDAKSGYLVEFNFAGGSFPKHVGIVEKPSPASLGTIEFNTSDADNINGGSVARRKRGYGPVLGYVKIV